MANVTCKSEYNLLEELFDSKRYNKRVRPVTNSQDAVTVTFGLVVKEIEGLVRSLYTRIIFGFARKDRFLAQLDDSPTKDELRQ